MEKIRIGIIGYGHLGRGVEAAVGQAQDMTLSGIFTRRNPAQVARTSRTGVVFSMDDVAAMTDQIDVQILCGGSLSDIPEQGPLLAGLFNTVDAYDNHSEMNRYFDSIDRISRAARKTCVIAAGWDPGLFSLQRIIAEAILPQGETYTFWGRGVSQGHSDAIRRVAGVLDAVQYTIPVDEAIQAVRSGSQPPLTARDKHRRLCYVVADPAADRELIARTIKEMPAYFADYDTTVHFISSQELLQKHSGLPHGGRVMRTGRSGADLDHKQTMEFSLALDSNPEFTAMVMVAYARAAYRLSKEGLYGAKTVADIAPVYLSSRPAADILRELI